MQRAIGKYSCQGNTEIAFELPMTTEILDSIQQAKHLSNEFLTKIFESCQENEPVKMKKVESDLEEAIE